MLVFAYLVCLFLAGTAVVLVSLARAHTAPPLLDEVDIVLDVPPPPKRVEVPPGRLHRRNPPRALVDDISTPRQLRRDLELSRVPSVIVNPPQTALFTLPLPRLEVSDEHAD